MQFVEPSPCLRRCTVDEYVRITVGTSEFAIVCPYMRKSSSVGVVSWSHPTGFRGR